ncbi:Gamma-glutamyltranspeptidase precursor [Azotobacter vinelandii CA]|uniref:Glutathione hydrolase proenzyme n=2 Tax=Azotobacter vinelandii TaxID=354 RepID=C1DIA9_AZOVD|nr:gamma-glutamyltransferase [Azotobacter vinelandii]ACO76606.1 Gamma-glutamyltranspeptidase precursor [Azotobacter vinelandii DJ]AGK17338.1 Gamma-glutamyltranspeptidase precursor [Azotobacter vinelandii CA]AGK19234.1 Gamma-glutamyltranspeptidase precursor [Azotobacter vinelandii CA6]
MGGDGTPVFLRRLLAGLALLACATALQAQTPGRAVLATPHPLAGAAGRDILQAGGNAFDAAVAVAASLAVVEPYGSGLGGGGFFLLREERDGAPPRYLFLDARERAPLAAHAELYLRDSRALAHLSRDGALAAAIPGLPAALVELAARHGRLPLRDSLAPAIRQARDGFPVERIYRQRARFRLSALRDDPESARLFLDDGEVPAEGHLVRQPELAETLGRLAERGHDGFYAGTTAERLVAGVRAAGGIWSAQDLAGYRVVERRPLRFALERGCELIGAPPPSAGGIALAQSLGMLAHLPWRTADRVQRAHYVVEVSRRAFRDRGLLGDPDFVANPVERLLAPAYLRDLAAGIDPGRATPSASLPPAPAWREGEHTTHFAVLDTEGNALAATLSINLPFGAAFAVPGTGVLLNDEMDDFAADPRGSNAYRLVASPANLVAAGKRPLSSMSPTFIESADDLAAFGTPGGSRIPGMVLLAVLEYLDGRPIERWPALPRYHHQYLPDVVEHEPDAFDAAELAELRRRGHRLKVREPYGNQQVLRWDKRSGAVEAASDPRGLGHPQYLPARR